MRRTFILLGACVLLMAPPSARAQVAGYGTLNSTGSFKILGTTEFDWSIGEMTRVNTIYGPLDASNHGIIVTEGVLQGDLSTPVKIADQDFARHLTVYPNPASSTVNLQYDAGSGGNLSYRLMDMLGKVIIQGGSAVKPGTATEQINISGLAAATYLLEVTFMDNNTVVATNSYKIEKLK